MLRDNAIEAWETMQKSGLEAIPAQVVIFRNRSCGNQAGGRVARLGGDYWKRS